MWFQHDGAPAHFSIDVRNYLNATFGARWIGCGGPVPWPPRSPDFSSLDYFLWGHLKSLVYETPVDSDDDLVARISAAAAENESVRSAFGRGVGFYIGEPCESTCNSILFHVYCNKTTGKCECHDHYPVNIENKVCVKAAHLGDSCEHDDACAFFDDNAVCPSGTCRCADGFRAAYHHKGAAICLPAGPVTFLEDSYMMTTISAVAGMVVFTALLCLVLRLFSKARFNRPADRMASAASPPTMMSAFTGSRILDSRRPSRSSAASTDYLPASRRASYSMLAPPSSLGSRRASSTSVRSQLSFRTQSSFRGYRYSRETVRRAMSSPADSSQQFPPSPCKIPNHQPPQHHHHHHHHNHHPLHHNSPVDEDDILDDSPVPTVNVNHLSNHI
ncbi:uncharacterized protein LOC129223166 [Uloborus diversus]|uniref:uncharacterized protein LOC129223166 n=1 Tax=Uloborus diversus TaxID=327109 RepID=UPI002408F9BF|nr:uncharacterized protein LOC129223166 [Uloborus diversus]